MTHADELFEKYLRANHRRTSHVFAALLVGQWIFGILVALVWSPYAWAGRIQSVHAHVFAAILLGGALSSLPLVLALARPESASTRLVIAVAQMLWSALLIHLSGGRIETHFHVFGSLAFLAFYRDWRVLVVATVVVSGDHLVRGLMWPESVYGIGNPEWWRFLEHAFWVVFENVVLVLACVRGVEETRVVANREAEAAASLARLADLNATLDLRVKERTEKLKEAQEQLMLASRKSGMADVATAVLHNVGNVLNSVNVSSGMIASTVRASKVSSIAKLGDLLSQPDVAPLLAAHEKARHVPAYVKTLQAAVATEHASVQREVESLQRNIEHIKVVISMQQTHAKGSIGVREPVALGDIIRDAITMNAFSADKDRIQVVEEIGDVPPTFLDRHKICEILMNLLSNARHAVNATESDVRRITIRLASIGADTVRVEVEDTGCGIPAENLTKVFSHGFTTREDGHGFGLHSSACTAMEMGGRLTCRSEGVGRGTVFTLELPARSMAAAA